ncbi:MAG: hypothetical protein KDH90_12410, partial [Anaerolineae bacterium]|nr:hypothetical protein [Anaerolineae bacterium]
MSEGMPDLDEAPVTLPAALPLSPVTVAAPAASDLARWWPGQANAPDVAQWRPPEPPDAFRVASEAVADDNGETVSLAGGRVQLRLSQAAPERTVRYQPLDASESGSPLGIAFELTADSADLDLVASPITLTLDYRDLAIPYRAAAESRLALFMQ